MEENKKMIAAPDNTAVRVALWRALHLPEKVLTINPSYNGYAIWYTLPQVVNLFFIKDLTIPNGNAKIPAMLWKATIEQLYVYALRPRRSQQTKRLYTMPRFLMSMKMVMSAWERWIQK